MNKLAVIIAFFWTLFVQAQSDSLSTSDSIRVVIDSVAIHPDSIETPLDISNFEPYHNVIQNDKALKQIFEKLYQLEQTKQGKVRIVHIGDSHIQADLFTAVMRLRFQQVFGNGGFGFTFPYSLANTNNSAPLRFTGSGGFSSARNLFADVSRPVGISGIALEPKQKNFHIDLLIKDAQYDFTVLKLISPQNQSIFQVSFAKKGSSVQEKVAVKTALTSSHKVKPGEVLGTIANKYNISIKQLKQANGLKSDFIRDGKVLKIPGGKSKVSYKTVTKNTYSYEPIALEKSAFTNNYISSRPLDKITIIGNDSIEKFALNGIILENSNPGVTYSGIGVNGAKAGDYTKFPLFFEQIPALEADLFVISLGTNESFDKQEGQNYYYNLRKMIEGIKAKAPQASILVTTPPPSKLHRKNYNSYIDSYSQIIQEQAPLDQFAVWNLLDVFGGNKNIILNSRMGLMAKDKVHYSKLGYEKQAELFFGAFIQSYELFKSEK